MFSPRVDGLSPGMTLKIHWLAPWGITQVQLANQIGCSSHSVNAIVTGERTINIRWAHLLARCFGNKPEYWLRLVVEWECAHYSLSEMELVRCKPFEDKIEPYFPKGRGK